MQTSIAHTDRLPTVLAFVPPLDIARENARRILDESTALDLDITNSFRLAGQFGAVCEVLRQVLAALDAEDGDVHG